MTGGIGQVWLACDERFGREVALKELRDERVGSPAITARFLREVKVTGQLEHPGIVPVYELGTRAETGEPFYTMRFVHGRTLAEATQDFHLWIREGRAGLLEFDDLLARKKNGSKAHIALDTLGNLLAEHVPPADEQERAQVDILAEKVQDIARDKVEVAFVDQGYTGEQTSGEAAEDGIDLIVVKHTEAKKGFVLLPRRWVVERTFGWLGRFRRLARDYERMAET